MRGGSLTKFFMLFMLLLLFEFYLNGVRGYLGLGS